MSLNIADALRQKLQEEHDFNAEQANGTLLVVDEMVDSGIDRVLGSIESLRTESGKDIKSLRTELGKDIESLRSDMDKRFNSVDRHFTLIQVLLPFASAFTTIILLAALAAIFGDAPSSVRWLIPI